MTTVSRHAPCPCCDLGGFDDEPCPARVEINRAEARVAELEATLRDVERLTWSSSGKEVIRARVGLALGKQDTHEEQCTRMPDGRCSFRAELEWIIEQLGGRLPGEARSDLVQRIAAQLRRNEQSSERPEAVHAFAGVDRRSVEGHLRSVLWEILGGMGAESVENAAQRVVRERDTARIERDTAKESAREAWIEVARRDDTIKKLSARHEKGGG